MIQQVFIKLNNRVDLLRGSDGTYFVLMDFGEAGWDVVFTGTQANCERWKESHDRKTKPFKEKLIPIKGVHYDDMD